MPDFHERVFGGLPLHESRSADYRLVDGPDLPHEIRSHISCFDQYTHVLCHRERLDRLLHRPLPEIALRRLKYRISMLKRRLRSKT